MARILHSHHCTFAITEVVDWVRARFPRTAVQLRETCTQTISWDAIAALEVAVVATPFTRVILICGLIVVG